jgi:hypothetical protein
VGGFRRRPTGGGWPLFRRDAILVHAGPRAKPSETPGFWHDPLKLIDGGFLIGVD